MAFRMKPLRLFAYLGACFFFSLMFSGSAAGGDFFLPDTGQTMCYNNSGEIPCPAEGQAFYGQDGNYRGPQPAYQRGGQDLTVTDLNTGLMWQQADDGITRSRTDAVSYCEGSSLGGYPDWRVPSLMELLSTVDYGVYSPATHSEYFTRNSNYWSDTTYAYPSDYAWSVWFEFGFTAISSVADKNYVCCVRGEPLKHGPFADNGDDTVTDTSTALMWQESDDGVPRTWEGALSYCENLSFPMGKHADWRLPNIHELESMVNYRRYDSAVDPVFVSKNDSYWSGTTYVYSPNNAWHVGFYDGYVSYSNKPVTYYVRCVRGGPSGSFGAQVPAILGPLLLD